MVFDVSSAADRKRLFNCLITLSDNVSLRLCQSFIPLCGSKKGEHRSVFVSSLLSIYGTNATCCHVQVTQRRKKQRKYKGQTTIVRTTTQLRRRKKRDGKWSIFVLQKSVCKTVLPIFSFCFGFSGLERRRCSIGKETFKNSTFFVLDFVPTDVRF